MPTRDSSQSNPNQLVSARGRWTWRERCRRTGIVVAEKVTHNIFTSYGLTQLAAGISGANVPPIYLAVEGTYTNLSASYAAGSSSIVVTTDVTQTGDTQLYLSAGLANQETVTFSSKVGTSPCTYTLSSPTIKAHTSASNDWVARVPLWTDTTSNLSDELQYDAVNFPNLRMASPGGYSPSYGQWTVQVYFPGPTMVGNLILCGLCDTATIGTGNLHNHFLLAVSHTNTNNDQEIDGVITIQNFLG